MTAIPAWINYMRVALDGMPESTLPRPPGIVERRINAETGQVAADCNPSGRWEVFLADNVPDKESNLRCLSGSPLPDEAESSRGSEQIFN